MSLDYFSPLPGATDFIAKEDTADTKFLKETAPYLSPQPYRLHMSGGEGDVQLSRCPQDEPRDFLRVRAQDKGDTSWSAFGMFVAARARGSPSLTPGVTWSTLCAS